MHSFWVILIAACLALSSCSQSGRQSSSCNAGESTTLEYASGFSIERFEGYTKVAVRNPWDTLKTLHDYILVDREQPVPADLPEGTLIKVPVNKAVIYTSVHSAMAAQMDCLDKICGVCEPQYITCREVLDGIKSGAIVDLGLSTAPDIEKIINLEAEVILASPFENSGYGSAEKIGMPIVEAADYMENHPLGRTEWIKFYGLLFGKEAEADSIFNETCRSYNELKEMAAGCNERPTVLLERKYGATWGVPGADSYIAVMHRDAGADYIFKEVSGTNSIQMSFENVFDEAYNADYWLMKHNNTGTFSYSDLKKEYQPYGNFEAFKNHRIFACNTVGTPYYDDITLHPDLILKDFISIYHPELLPGYKAKYYKPLDE